MIRILLALALSAAPSLAQSTGPRCSDTTVEFRPTLITFGTMTECSGTQLTIGNTRLDQASNQCPQLVVVTPAHYAPAHSPGCGTNARIDHQSPIAHYRYHCGGHFAWFVRLTSECVLDSWDNIGSVPSYTIEPCDRLPQPSADGPED